MRYIETIKILNGVPCNLPYHIQRMKITSGAILSHIEIPSEFKNGVVKCRIIYSTEIIETTFAQYNLPSILSLKVVESRDIEYSKKYENRSQITRLFNTRGTHDDILISRNGLISDTSFCNVIFENEEGLFTPCTPLLAGTKRAKLLSDRVVLPRFISVDDIQSYNSIRLINAMIELEDNISISTSNVLFNFP